jgi:long-chain acyl-CoA synthetase
MPTGHLKIIDRAKDVGKLHDGTLFAPKYLENKLKFFPHIKEAVAFGHGQPEATAMINIDAAGGGRLGGAPRHSVRRVHDLASKPESRSSFASASRRSTPISPPIPSSRAARSIAS